MSSSTPVLAITMGDPCGIGPEIVVKTIRDWNLPAIPVVVGDKTILSWAEEKTGIKLKWNNFQWPIPKPGFYLINCLNVDYSSFQWGKMNPHSGQWSFEYIQTAVQLAMKGNADAVVTAPINKEALNLSGVPFIGHTEIVKELTHSSTALTMFQLGQLRVFFLTRHLPLLQAVQSICQERVSEFLLDMERYLKAIGIPNARIAVAALNPHGGENGLLGREEIDEIGPAIDEVRKQGVNVLGIFPADSVFWFAKQGRFDAVLSLYHDQGHIATKCMNFYRTVSVTLGLPFIRTSPDHGTAFDIAGRGIANHQSLVESCRLASEYALAYRSFVNQNHETNND